MNVRPALVQPSLITRFAAATLASIVAIGILAAVTVLLQRNGAPMAQLAAAERACVEHIYVSEREACMRRWLTAERAPSMASK